MLKPEDVDAYPTISEERALELLDSDLQRCYKEVQQYWGVHIKSIGHWRLAAIMNATYACTTLRWPKLTRAVCMNNWESAAEELMDSRYAHQVTEAKRNACILRDNEQYTIKSENWDQDE
jgi:hypothetical protein